MTHVFSSKHSINLFFQLNPLFPAQADFYHSFPILLNLTILKWTVLGFQPNNILIIGISLSSVCYSTVPFNSYLFHHLLGAVFTFTFLISVKISSNIT